MEGALPIGRSSTNARLKSSPNSAMHTYVDCEMTTKLIMANGYLLTKLAKFKNKFVCEILSELIKYLTDL
jgi:hypothetical protein